jgi:hypothetical protein
MATQVKTVFLLVHASGDGPDRKTYFNRAGVAFVNKDGSLNVKLDLFPALTFNIRDAQQNGDKAPDSDKPF